MFPIKSELEDGADLNDEVAGKQQRSARVQHEARKTNLLAWAAAVARTRQHALLTYRCLRLLFLFGGTKPALSTTPPLERESE